jgi:hypothetical protein
MRIFNLTGKDNQDDSGDGKPRDGVEGRVPWMLPLRSERNARLLAGRKVLFSFARCWSAAVNASSSCLPKALRGAAGLLLKRTIFPTGGSCTVPPQCYCGDDRCGVDGRLMIEQAIG